MNEKRGASSCRNAVKNGSTQKKGFEITSKQQALLFVKVGGCGGPRGNYVV
jgi:hypothetical protein